MSLFGAMNTAVSGLSAQSNAFGNISDNVANSQTIGYKRVDTSFIDYLTSSTAANNVPGSVVTRPDYVNNVEGTITQTDNALGLAITGQGFFAVSKQAGTANNLPTFEAQQEYTRAGDFQMDKNGYLKNSAGLFLNGWGVNQTTGLVNQNTLAPIQVSQTVFNPVATTGVTISANLPATPAPGTATGNVLYQPTDPAVITAQNNASAATALAATAGAAAADALTGTTAAVDAAAGANAANTAAGLPAATVASVLAAIPAGSTASTAANTAATLANATASSVALAAADAAATAAGTPPTTPTIGGVPLVLGTTVKTPASPISSDITVYDALGTAHDVTLNWVKNTAPATDWTVSITMQGDAAFSGSANVAFGAPQQAGTLSAVGPTTGNVSPSLPYDPTNPAAQPASLILNADFGSGAQPITLNLGTYGGTGGMTQYAGTDYNLRGLTQNGVPPGAFASVSTATNGDIAVNYDNGQTRVIARVPVITFNNPNGLQRQDGQSFTVSQDSGGPLAETANTNGAGGLITQSVEGSNVDIASEFTKLIVAQRAYSANTKIVTTSDDMLQQTIDMKR